MPIDADTRFDIASADDTGQLLDAGFSFDDTTAQHDALDVIAETESEPGDALSCSNSNHSDRAIVAMSADAVDDGDGAQYGAGFVTLFGVSADRTTVIALSCNMPDLAIDAVTSGLLEIWSRVGVLLF